MIQACLDHYGILGMTTTGMHSPATTFVDLTPHDCVGMCRKLKEGQRVVAVPWPSTEGEGTWQQYVAVPLENLVSWPAYLSATVSRCKQSRGSFQKKEVHK